ncbi:hypothetical protein D3C77_474030 [compost metagenome]
MIETGGQKHQAKGVLRPLGVVGCCGPIQLFCQLLDEVRRRQKALIAAALADTALERRHHQASRGLAQLLGQCLAARFDRSPGGSANGPRGGGGNVLQACQTQPSAGQLGISQRLGRVHFSHPLGGLSRPLHFDRLPAHSGAVHLMACRVRSFLSCSACSKSRLS